MTVGVMGVGLAGCGCDCPTGAAAARIITPRSEACTALANLSNSVDPVTVIRPTTPLEEVRKLRDDIERESPKVIDKRGLVPEDLRVNLSAARKDFDTAVDTFGTATPTVGSSAPRLNEQFQAVRGTVRSLRVNFDCSQPDT
jgi:hypothetical protein